MGQFEAIFSLRGRAAGNFAAKQPGHIRVVTFNAHFGRRAEAIAAAFRGNPNLAAADVVLLQEIEHHRREPVCRAEVVARGLGMWHAYIPVRPLSWKRGTHGLGVLSRLPFRDMVAIRLPTVPLLKFRPRVSAKVSLRWRGREISLYNVHLNGTLNYRQRERQLEEVLHNIEKEGRRPVVMAGDFNTIPLFMLGQALPIFYSNQKKLFHDLLKKRGFNTQCEGLGHTLRRGPALLQLDGIYPKNSSVAQFGVERGIRVSDHFPVWADISIDS